MESLPIIPGSGVVQQVAVSHCYCTIPYFCTKPLYSSTFQSSVNEPLRI